MHLTPAQRALMPRVRAGDVAALAEVLSLGLGTGVTIGRALDEPTVE